MFTTKKKKKREELFEEFGKIKSDSFDFEMIEKYFRNKNQSESFQVLSDKTCNDLDFDEFFMFIDRTNSKVGQQFLYNKLRTIPSNYEKRDLHEKLIEELSLNQELRISIQSRLKKLNDFETFYITTLFQEEHISPPKWFPIVPILSFTSIFSIIMSFFNPRMLFVLLGAFLINIGIHYWNKKNLYQYLSSLPRLLNLNHVAKKLFKIDILKNINPNINESIKIVDKIRNRTSLFKVESKLQNDLNVVFWGIMELLKISFLIEPLLLFGVLKRIETKRNEIENLFNYVGEIDSIISIASLRKGLDYFCIPNIHKESKTIVTNNIYHPLIIDCVKNNIHVNGKSILLTGSNMSGKTSFIRTIGLNVISGLTLNTCFAEQFAMPKIRIYSAIRISDDLMNDKSYYFEEVLTIKEMIDQSETGQNLFLLDEIFKGTNTIERISAGKAVLSTLNKGNNVIFVSTHDIELADLLKNEYALYHFSETVDQKMVDFDYKLKDGKLKNRNAIRILQINGYPENIISEAIELSRQLDQVSIERI